jgi:hypothetical protein
MISRGKGLGASLVPIQFLKARDNSVVVTRGVLL